MYAGRVRRVAVLILVFVAVVGPFGVVFGHPPGDSSGSPAVDDWGTAQVATNTTPTPEVTPTGSPVEMILVNVTPSSVDQDEPFTVEVTLVNRGSRTESKTVEFEADYVEVDNATVTLRPGAETTIEFTHRFAEPGDKTIELDHTVTRTVRVRQTKFPDLRITSIETNEPAIADRPHSVSVTVVNGGNATGAKTVEFEADYREVDNRTVTLDPGQRETIEFSYRFTEPGTELVEFDHRYSRNITVVPASPDFSVTNARVDQGTVESTEPIRILVNVTNTGEVDGRYPVALRIDGEVVDVNTVLVPVGQHEQVVFTRHLDPGAYTVAVETFEFDIEVVPGDGAEPTHADSNLTLPLFGWPIEVVVLFPIAAVIVLLAAATRGRA